MAGPDAGADIRSLPPGCRGFRACAAPWRDHVRAMGMFAACLRLFAVPFSRQLSPAASRRRSGHGSASRPDYHKRPLPVHAQPDVSRPSHFHGRGSRSSCSPLAPHGFTVAYCATSSALKRASVSSTRPTEAKSVDGYPVFFKLTAFANEYETIRCLVLARRCR